MNGNVAKALLAVVLLMLVGLWVFYTFERVEVETRLAPSPEARRNPYLAAQRFLARMGRESGEFANPTGKTTPAPNATLVLTRGGGGLTPLRVRGLLDWVSAGGHLVLEPDAVPDRDAILAALRVTTRKGESRVRKEASAVELPTAPEPLRIAPASPYSLDPGENHPLTTVSDAEGPILLHLRHGAGYVTVLTGMSRFTNYRIGTHDHAGYLWAVVQLAPTRGPVLWVQTPDAPPLWRWLLDNAGNVLLAAGILLALWLWRVLPRFGPTHPAPVRGSRALVHHLTAAGRFRWAHGGRVSLLLAAREVCLMRIAAAQPRIAHLPPADRNRELAALVGMSDGQIASAFGGSPRNPHEFVATLHVLSRIHDGLRHPGRSASPRKARP